MESPYKSYVIRPLKEDDCSQVMDMMLELGEFTNERHLVRNTVEGLRRDMFRQPIKCSGFGVELIENGVNTNSLVAYGLYYVAYSAMRGQYMYMDNLFVMKKHRRGELGRRLYQAVTQKALDLDLDSVEFTARQSNKTAMDFYKNLGTIDKTNIDGRRKLCLPQQQMKALVMLEHGLDLKSKL